MRQDDVPDIAITKTGARVTLGKRVLFEGPNINRGFTVFMKAQEQRWARLKREAGKKGR